MVRASCFGLPRELGACLGVLWCLPVFGFPEVDGSAFLSGDHAGGMGLATLFEVVQEIGHPRHVEAEHLVQLVDGLWSAL